MENKDKDKLEYTPRYKAWVNELLGIQRFLSNATEMRGDYDKEWLSSMCLYYRARLKTLQESMPAEKYRSSRPRVRKLKNKDIK